MAAASAGGGRGGIDSDRGLALAGRRAGAPGRSAPWHEGCGVPPVCGGAFRSADANVPRSAGAFPSAMRLASALQPTARLQSASDGAAQRPPAPMFAGTFMDGNDYQLEDTVGTPTLLMFWAPW